MRLQIQVLKVEVHSAAAGPAHRKDYKQVLRGAFPCHPEADPSSASPPYRQSYLIVEAGEERTAAFILRDKPSAHMNRSRLRKSPGLSPGHHAASAREFQSGIHSSKPPALRRTRAWPISDATREREKQKERIENERRSCCSLELCLTGRAQEV